jgi:hypothetical protein
MLRLFIQLGGDQNSKACRTERERAGHTIPRAEFSGGNRKSKRPAMSGFSVKTTASFTKKTEIVGQKSEIVRL